MWILYVLLILLVLVIIYLLYRNGKLPIINKYKNKILRNNFDNIKAYNEPNIPEPVILNNNKENKLKSYFTSIQFHTDYRDVITAFNDLTINKSCFNNSNETVDYTSCKNEEVNDLINEFIIELNKDIKYNVADYRNASTGWDEPLPQHKVKSGWEKMQEELGLPTSLYEEPTARSPVKLILIDRTEKYITKDEIKYVCTIIIQKLNTDDQMIVKISFIKNNNNNDIIIEEIFIIGYLTDEGTPKDGNVNDQWYNFKSLNKNDITSDKMIMKELIKKYQDKHEDDIKFTKSLDPESKAFHDGLRDVSTYNSFKNTRSIYEDLMNKSIQYE